MTLSDDVHLKSAAQPKTDVFRFLNTNSVHEFGESDRGEFDEFIQKCGDIETNDQCQYCGAAASKWRTSEERCPEYNGPSWRDAEAKDIDLVVCSVCGWFRYRVLGWMSDDQYPMVTHAIATLGNDSSGNYVTPIVELDQYLKMNWNDRKELSAGRAEQLIAEVFKEHLNCEVIYTTNGVYSPDGGIDFVLINSNAGIEYAFQVKRRLADSPERIQPVREFIGAVASSRYKHGFYVTTAERFTKSTRKELASTVSNLAARDMHLTLVDGDVLRSLLKQKKAASATVRTIRHWFRPDSVWNGTKNLDQMISEAFQI